MSNKTITKTLNYATQIQSSSSAKPATPSNPEFERFAALAKGLVQVPKEALDEKRRES